MNTDNAIAIERESPTLPRLFTSHLFDFVFFALIAFLLNFAYSPLVGTFPISRQMRAEREEIQLQSHLYVKEESELISIVDSLKKESLPMKEEATQLDEALNHFFYTFIYEESKSEGDLYRKFKVEAVNKDNVKLFDASGNRNQSNPDFEADYLFFYREVASEKAPGYLVLKKGYLEARRNLILLQCLCLAFSITTSYLLFYLFPPLIFHRGKQTIGFKINGLYLLFVDGLSPRLPRFLLYSLFRYLFFYLLAIPTFFLPYFISLGMMILRKEKQTLSEYLFALYPIKGKKEEVFESQKELLSHTKINEE